MNRLTIEKAARGPSVLAVLVLWPADWLIRAFDLAPTAPAPHLRRRRV